MWNGSVQTIVCIQSCWHYVHSLLNIFCNHLNPLSDAEQTCVQDLLFWALIKLTRAMALVAAKTSCQSKLDQPASQTPMEKLFS